MKLEFDGGGLAAPRFVSTGTCRSLAVLLIAGAAVAGCQSNGAGAAEQVHNLDRIVAEQRRANEALRSELGAAEKALADARVEAERLRGRDAAYAEAAERLRTRLAELEASFADTDDGISVEALPTGGFRFIVQDAILFRTGDAEVTPAGAEALRRVAASLKGRRERIRVEGHTDNVPIGKAETRARFPLGNLDLSLARALHVADFLIKEGVEARRVSAAGHGQHRPRADNGTEDGRSRNRRVEILVVEE